MKHLKLFEEFESSVISIFTNGEEQTFTILSDNKKVYLMKDGDVYQRLDIQIPNSDELNIDEFFMAPDVKKEIVEELEKQRFIQKLNIESVSGDKKVTAYKL